MEKIEHEFELAAEEQEPVDQCIGVSLDEDEAFHSAREDDDFESEDDDFEPADPESAFTSNEHDLAEVIEVDEDEWITSDNFDEKLKDGLGMGGLRL